jgi:hypothetical protein
VLLRIKAIHDEFIKPKVWKPDKNNLRKSPNFERFSWPLEMGFLAISTSWEANRASTKGLGFIKRRTLTKSWVRSDLERTIRH